MQEKILEKTLKVNEIFHSIQGESSLNGVRCVFIRLTYCNLRCSYCDTEYAFFDGRDMSIREIIEEAEKYRCRYVEITGGEPLIQENVHELMKELCRRKYDVLIETGGSLSIEKIDKRVKIIMDLKCPSSGMHEKNMYDNIYFLRHTDEVKFVIGDRDDYEWCKKILSEYKLTDKTQVLLSPVFGHMQNHSLVQWILEDKLNVRFQIQLHKYVWSPEMKGV